MHGCTTTCCATQCNPTTRDDRLLTPHETATQLGVAVDTLTNWRALYGQERIRYIKINARDVRYRQSAVRTLRNRRCVFRYFRARRAHRFKFRSGECLRPAGDSHRQDDQGSGPVDNCHYSDGSPKVGMTAGAVVAVYQLRPAIDASFAFPTVKAIEVKPTAGEAKRQRASTEGKTPAGASQRARTDDGAKAVTE